MRNPTNTLTETTHQLMGNYITQPQQNALKQPHQSDHNTKQSETTPLLLNNPFSNFRPKPSSSNRRSPGVRFRGRGRGF
jgi:hypothetical protein